MTDLSALVGHFPDTVLPMSGSSMLVREALSYARKHFTHTSGLQHAAGAMRGSGQPAAPATTRNVTNHPQGMQIDQS